MSRAETRRVSEFFRSALERKVGVSAPYHVRKLGFVRSDQEATDVFLHSVTGVGAVLPHIPSAICQRRLMGPIPRCRARRSTGGRDRASAAIGMRRVFRERPESRRAR